MNLVRSSSDEPIREPRRILFVDDEPLILQGIVRMLRPQRAELTILTAGGGPEALDLLAREKVDVLVSDMRMPGMDGAELLERVRLRYPHVMRIILSGQSDQLTIIRACRTTHQFLSKPCNQLELRGAVLRCCALRDVLEDAPLAARIIALEGLPSAPGALAALHAELKSGADFSRIGRLVDADPGLASKLIQLTATSFFGTPHGVVTPSAAAVQLGADVLRSLIATDALPQPGAPGINWDSWTSTARRAAILARQFALEVDPTLAAAAETAGLLHDCATAVLELTSSGAYRLNGIQAARQHADVSAFMLGLWGFPDAIVEAVARHSMPSLRLGQRDLLCGLVHVASAIAADRRNRLDLPFLTTLSLDSKLELWLGSADSAEGNP